MGFPSPADDFADTTLDVNKRACSQTSLFSLCTIHSSISDDDHLTLRPSLIGLGNLPSFIHLYMVVFLKPDTWQTSFKSIKYMFNWYCPH